jgi:hypothetical protein
MLGRRMIWQIAWLAAASALIGCAHAGHQVGHLDIEGSRDDVKTRSGEYDGYAVTFDCRYNYMLLSVIGRGKRWFNDAEPGSPGRDAAVVRFKDHILPPAVDDLHSVEGYGCGLGCRGINATLYMHDWREVDAVVQRVGALLKSLDLREEVSVGIMGPLVVL